MESLSDTTWDVIICGTGLQQSLLALALSRSDKKVLHIDPNDYYGGPEAALTLQDAEAWAKRHSSQLDHGSASSPVFSHAAVTKPSSPEAAGRLSFARAYSLALCPQIIHARSELLSQLVSSRAYRQLEFLAVGSFFVLRPSSTHGLQDDEPPQQQAPPTLTRIPSTREDVFSSTALPARSKRALMKFLKFVLEHDTEGGRPQWQARADEPLAAFLRDRFGLDAELQSYVLALTLSLGGLHQVKTGEGLAAIHRQVTSMGVFGPGFAAVYPKWGGLGEVAQVACRAGAVGGAVYMLGTGVEHVTAPPAGEKADDAEDAGSLVRVQLSNGTTVRARQLVRALEEGTSGPRVGKLIAVIDSPLKPLFEAVVEGAPTPAVAVIACPAGSIPGQDAASEYPVYAMAHSAECGECPVGQSVLYLSTITSTESKGLLERALLGILSAAVPESPPPCLYQLYYEQSQGDGTTQSKAGIFTFPMPSATPSFQDSSLDAGRQAWELVTKGPAKQEGSEYMAFPDREGAEDDDDKYD